MPGDVKKQSFAFRLKKARELSGHSQRVFADVIGVSFRTLQRYESGENVPDRTTATRIEKAIEKYQRESETVRCEEFLRAWREEPTPWHNWVMSMAMQVARTYAGVLEDLEGITDVFWVIDDVIQHLDCPQDTAGGSGRSPEVMEWLGQLKDNFDDSRKAIIENSIALATERMRFAGVGWSAETFSEALGAGIQFFAFGRTSNSSDQVLS